MAAGATTMNDEDLSSELPKLLPRLWRFALRLASPFPCDAAHDADEK